MKNIHMNEIDKIFNELCNKPSDINEHLPTLKKYAERCKHITEFGTRYVVSTWAFLYGYPEKLVCYDLLLGLNLTIVEENINRIKKISDELNISFEFNAGDVLEKTIEETDLLFIDTYHEYNQLKNELRLHSKKVKKYLIFHDTTTYGEFGETFKEPNTKGILPAINEFLNDNEDWTLIEKFENNNGLIILEKNGK